MKNIHEFIAHFNVFNIVSHKDPDGDCVGSSIALSRYLKSLGKTAHLYSPGPFARFGIEEYHVFFNGEPFDCSPDAGIIILDCSTIDRIGRFAEVLTGGACRVAVIDHHSSGEPFGETRLIDPAAPSTTFLVQRLIEEAGTVMDAETAQWLLYGLCTDTGYFRHISAGSGTVFEAAGRLVAAGADPSKAYKTMYGGRTLSSRKLLGRLLDRTEAYNNGRLLVTWETLKDLQDAEAGDRDSDILYSLLQGVKNTEAVVFVREEKPGELSAGLRSNNHLDVGAIAKDFGGGGHKQAAGLEWKGSLKDLKTLLTEAVLKNMSG